MMVLIVPIESTAMTERIPANRQHLQGIACALAVVARDLMEPDIARYALSHFGLTVSQLEIAGAAPHDLDALRKV